MFASLAVLRHWKLVLCAALILALGIQTVRIIGKDRVIAALRLDNAKLRFDLDQVKIATEIADKKAREAKAKAEAEYKRKAELTDAKHQSELAAARRRASAYADRNRVPAPASGRPASGAAPAPDRDGSQGPDGPGDGSGVVVTRADFDTLVDNTLRLKAAREWACGLEGARCD